MIQEVSGTSVLDTDYLKMALPEPHLEKFTVWQIMSYKANSPLRSTASRGWNESGR